MAARGVLPTQDLVLELEAPGGVPDVFGAPLPVGRRGHGGGGGGRVRLVPTEAGSQLPAALDRLWARALLLAAAGLPGNGALSAQLRFSAPPAARRFLAQALGQVSALDGDWAALGDQCELLKEVGRISICRHSSFLAEPRCGGGGPGGGGVRGAVLGAFLRAGGVAGQRSRPSSPPTGPSRKPSGRARRPFCAGPWTRSTAPRAWPTPPPPTLTA